MNIMNNVNKNLYKINEPEYINLGLTGLANIGNTCYLNSCIQLLSHSYELSNLLKHGNYKSKLKKIPDSILLIEWDKLRELMWSENCTIAPYGFVKAVHNIASQKNHILFTGYQQNDIYEFFLFLLDSFHNALSREVNMEITGIAENNTDKLAENCYKMIQNMYKNEYSEILEIFYGIHISEIISIENNKTLSSKPEPFSALHLSINNSKTIYECLDKYCEKEELIDDNAWFNEKTKTKINVKKGIVFWSFPEILIITLKRWNIKGNKINNVIDTPLNDLDLSKYIYGYNNISYIYDLFGVGNHTGNSLGGHYFAYIKNLNNKWYEYNDTNINEIESSNIITSKCYCLFYRKKK